MEIGCAISLMTFIGVMTTTGSVKPLSQPRKPLFLMLWYQTMPVVTSAHVIVVLRSAVALRNTPPSILMSVPKTDEQNSAPI